MNRAEFMKQLKQLLNDISEGERQEALDYYESYFDDAGTENEADVIHELGSPGKVAAIIKADLGNENDGGEFGEYTEKGYKDSREENDQVPEVYQKVEDDSEKSKGKSSSYQYQSRAQRGYQAPAKKNNSGNLILIIVILVLSCWLWGPLLVGVLGTVFGIAVALLCIVLSLGIGAVCLLICGIVFAVIGMIKCFSAPGLGFLEIAMGLGAFVIGILMMLVFAWIAVKLLPWLVRKTVELCQKLIQKTKRQKGEEA